MGLSWRAWVLGEWAWVSGALTGALLRRRYRLHDVGGVLATAIPGGLGQRGGIQPDNTCGDYAPSGAGRRLCALRRGRAICARYISQGRSTIGMPSIGTGMPA